MTKAEIRLECLRLAIQHGAPLDLAIKKATSFEEWILGVPRAPTEDTVDKE